MSVDRLAGAGMSVLADISLLRPLWILAIPLIMGLAVLSARRRAMLGDWTAHIDPHLMRAMADLGKVDYAGGQRLRHLPFWAAGAIALALLGPALERGNGQTFRNLDGVVFVVDVSRSMTRDASWPAAVTVVQAGLSALGTKPAALIVFGGDTYLAASLTTDHLQLLQTVALLDDTTVPDRGSRPALALQQAAGILESVNILAGDVVLVTDGAGVGAETLSAASAISQLNGRLTLVHVATTISEEAPIPAVEFETLAKLGGGQVFRSDQIEALMDTLGNNAQTRLARQDFQLLFWTDYGRYLLLLALIPAAGFFRREAA